MSEQKNDSQAIDLRRGRVEGTAIPLRGDDIDTDRIIPARYLKNITFDDLGAYAFYDERFDSSGSKKSHPFNDTRFERASLLAVNKNFGCGSSREHAPQSLMRMGIRAIVGESFAEIFAGNCTALGIPTVRADPGSISTLHEQIESEPGRLIAVDLEERIVVAGEFSFSITIPESYRLSLVHGTWDTTAALLQNRKHILEIGASLPYIKGY